MSTRGVLFIAWGGEHFRNLAWRAGQSAKKFGWSTALLHCPRFSPPAGVFDQVIPCDFQGFEAHARKALIFEYSPFVEFAFVDLDAVIVGDITPAFNRLDQSPIALAMDRRQRSSGRPYYNSGVLFVRRNDASAECLKTSNIA